MVIHTSSVYLEIIFQLTVELTELIAVILHKFIIHIADVADFVRPVATHIATKCLVHNAHSMHTLAGVVELQLQYGRFHPFQEMQHIRHTAVDISIERIHVLPAFQPPCVFFFLDGGGARVCCVGLSGAFKRRFWFVLQLQFSLRFCCGFRFILFMYMQKENMCS